MKIAPPRPNAPASPLWHPFTQHATAGPMIEIARADGAWLYGSSGQRYLDAISSWWVITHGHGHPAIAAAIARQALTLEQVIFAGFTHPPAEVLARKLLALAPRAEGSDPLAFVFLSDSGSTAVEVGLKMAVGYWHNIGRPRHRIVAFEDGYHGDTFGAMSVGGRGVFTSPYQPMLFAVDFLPFPAPGREQATLDAFAALLAAHGNEVAALIVEPLVLGAAGMLTYEPSLLAELAALARRHDVFLVADEVMTGFGRTGTTFACEQTGIVPDVMCLSKGITGGFLPMGATLATRRLYEAFWSEDRGRMFFHSSSYTGNPIACAAAVANLEVWEREPVLARIEGIAAVHARRLPAFRDHPQVRDVRGRGSIAAIELAAPKCGYLSELSPRLYGFFVSRGLLLRPIGNVVYLLPPYCISNDELDGIYDGIEDALAALRDRNL
ncbi:MAG TPA: adenosylmethionine--8-amino-7-oxononanoate transaminase [Rhodospirillales bacterium]|nr:adenosylmethionine--8-amino-7-oxononanoate transaminase [Rhodospirillales bacterium]